MKKLIAACFFLASSMVSAQTPIAWVGATEIFTHPSHPAGPVPIFINSYTYTGPSPGGWIQIDLKPYGVTADAKAAFLGGILIITHGTSQQTCDLTVSLRAPGSTLAAGNYVGQTVESHVGGGQRSNMSAWVPLVNGIFEFQWNRNTFGQWPQECSYGINLSLQAWTK